jgi:hypothetical protein
MFIFLFLSLEDGRCFGTPGCASENQTIEIREEQTAEGRSTTGGERGKDEGTLFLARVWEREEAKTRCQLQS